MGKLLYVAALLVGVALVVRHLYRGDRSPVSVPSAAGKTFFITGGNTGLGLASVQHLLEAGAGRVIFTVRSEEKARHTVARLRAQFGEQVPAEPIVLDLEDVSRIRNVAANLVEKGNRIDALILNAGVMICPYGLTTHGWERMFGVNHMGHFALTVPLLQADLVKRVVVVSSTAAFSSGGIDFEDIATRPKDAAKGFGMARSWKVYGDSKLANLLFAEGLRRRFPKVEIATSHPGYSHTDLQRHSVLASASNHLFAQDVALGALTQVLAAVSPMTRQHRAREWWGPSGLLELSGNPTLKETAPVEAEDKEAAEKLWKLSEHLLEDVKLIVPIL